MSKATVALQALLDCAEAELDQPPCQVFLSAGPPAWDWCCDQLCDGAPGQLTAHAERIFPYTTWPLEDRQADPCRGERLAADVFLVLLRCVPDMDSQGNPPSAESQTATATQSYQDVDALRAAFCCYPGRHTVGSVTFARPSGGCLAVGLRAILDLSDHALNGLPS